MTLSELGGSPKTYRVADNLTIGYQNFGDIPTIWSQELATDSDVMEMVAASDELMDNHARTDFVMDAVSASQTAMDAVSTSQTAMDAVSASQTAMDSVSTSSTAMDAVSASQTAMDSVSASQTAMDSVSTSSTAMDAVSASQTAMDSVSTSSTAMDAVSASLIARTAVIGNQHAIDTLWSTTTGSETWLNGFQTQTGSSFQSLVAGPTSNGSAVEMDIRNSGNTASTRGWTLDPDGFSTLEWKDRVPDSNYYSGGTFIRVKVNGDTVYSKAYGNSTQDAWTTRTVDISTYSAQGDVVLEAETQGDSTSYITAQFGDIILS